MNHPLRRALALFMAILIISSESSGLLNIPVSAASSGDLPLILPEVIEDREMLSDADSDSSSALSSPEEGSSDRDIEDGDSAGSSDAASSDNREASPAAAPTGSEGSSADDGSSGTAFSAGEESYYSGTESAADISAAGDDIADDPGAAADLNDGETSEDESAAYEDEYPPSDFTGLSEEEVLRISREEADRLFASYAAETVDLEAYPETVVSEAEYLQHYEEVLAAEEAAADGDAVLPHTHSSAPAVQKSASSGSSLLQACGHSSSKAGRILSGTTVSASLPHTATVKKVTKSGYTAYTTYGDGWGTHAYLLKDSDGSHTAICLIPSAEAPADGNYSGSAIAISKNSKFVKCLYYGYGGYAKPAKAGLVTTHIAAAKLFGSSSWSYRASSDEIKAANKYIKKLASYPDPPAGTYAVILKTGAGYQYLAYVKAPKKGYALITKEYLHPKMAQISGSYDLKASFHVFSSSDKHIATITTDASAGSAKKVKLAPGTYTVKEVSASKGTKLNTEMKKVTVKSGETAVVTFQNDEYDHGRITIDRKLSRVFGTQLKGAVYRIDTWSTASGDWKDAGVPKLSDSNKTSAELYETADNGGRFRVVEITAPSGYQGGWIREFNVTDNSLAKSSGYTFIYDAAARSCMAHFTAYNLPNPYVLAVKKVSAADNSLSLTGAEFTVSAWSRKKKTYTVLGKMAYQAAAGLYTFEVQADDDNGGLFKIEESKAPEGFRGGWSREISLSASSPHSYISAPFIAGDDYHFPSAAITLTKKDAVTGRNIGAQAVFRVYEWNRKTRDYEMNRPVSTLVGQNGIYKTKVTAGSDGIQSTDLQIRVYADAPATQKSADYIWNEGRFLVREESAPSGYLGGWQKEYSFGSGSLTEIKEAAETVSNTPNSYTILKTGTEEDDSLDAVFAFRYSGPAKSASLYLFDDPDRTVRFSGEETELSTEGGLLKLCALPEGVYTYREISVKTAGYKADGKVLYFTVGKDGKITAGEGALLTEVDGTAVSADSAGSRSSSASGTPGSSGSSTDASRNSGRTGGSLTTRVINAPAAKLFITKTISDAAVAEGLNGFPAGTSFSVTEWEAESQEYRTDRTFLTIVWDGSAFVDRATGRTAELTHTNENQGRFRVTEKTSTPGYLLDRTPQDVTVPAKCTEETELHLTFGNRPNHVLLRKTDTSGKSLNGAQFTFSSAGENARSYRAESGSESYLSSGSSEALPVRTSVRGDGIIELEAVPPGTWTFVETAAPEGYTTDSEVRQFIVREDGTVCDEQGHFAESAELTVENTKAVYLRLRKTDAKTGKLREYFSHFPEGTVFGIYEYDRAKGGYKTVPSVYVSYNGEEVPETLLPKTGSHAGRTADDNRADRTADDNRADRTADGSRADRTKDGSRADTASPEAAADAASLPKTATYYLTIKYYAGTWSTSSKGSPALTMKYAFGSKDSDIKSSGLMNPSNSMLKFTNQTVTGYHFVGNAWRIGSASATKTISASTTYATINALANALGVTNHSKNQTVRLYSYFDPNYYNIAFSANGGSGSMSAVSARYNTSYTLTNSSFTRSGYTFTGWNTKANGTGTAYANRASVKNLSTGAAAQASAPTVTLYAQWKANPTPTPTQAPTGTPTPTPTPTAVPTPTPLPSYMLTLDLGEHWRGGQTLAISGKTYGTGAAGGTDAADTEEFTRALSISGRTANGSFTSAEEFSLPTPETEDGWIFLGWRDSSSGTSAMTSMISHENRNRSFTASYLESGSFLDPETGHLPLLHETASNEGRFMIRELTATPGYILSGDEVHFTTTDGSGDELIRLVEGELRADFENVPNEFRIYKKDADTGLLTNGISFRVWKDGDEAHASLYEGNPVELSRLSPGIWHFAEDRVSAAALGYIADDNIYNIYVEADGTIRGSGSMTVWNSKKSNLFRIRKVDEEGVPLAHIVFDITAPSKAAFTANGETQEGQMKYQLETNEDGLILLSDLPPGEWAYAEAAEQPAYAKGQYAPSGSGSGSFTVGADGSVGNVKIAGETAGAGSGSADSGSASGSAGAASGVTGSSTATVVNRGRRIRILKTDGSGKPLAGAEFHLTNDLPEEDPGFVDDILTSGNDGLMQITNPANAIWTLEELSAPDGYRLLSGTIRFRPEDDGNVTILAAPEGIMFRDGAIVIQNSPSRFVLTKRNTDGQPLGGAVFRIRGNSFDETKTVGSDGRLVIEGLLPGTYRVEEVKAPEGCVRDRRIRTVIISGKESETEVIFTNSNSELRILKVDAESGEALKGAVFELRRSTAEVDTEGSNAADNNTTNSIVSDNAADSAATGSTADRYTTGNNTAVSSAAGTFYNDGTHPDGLYTSDSEGLITLSGLPEGSYSFRETAAPEGYTLPDHSWQFTVDADGRLHSDAEEAELLAEGTETFAASTLLFRIKNDRPEEPTPPPTRQKEPPEIRIYKTDAYGQPLQNVTFEYRKNGGSRTKLPATDRDGITTLQTETGASYEIREASVPEGMMPDVDENGNPKIYRCSVDENGVLKTEGSSWLSSDVLEQNTYTGVGQDAGTDISPGGTGDDTSSVAEGSSENSTDSNGRESGTDGAADSSGSAITVLHLTNYPQPQYLHLFLRKTDENGGLITDAAFRVERWSAAAGKYLTDEAETLALSFDSDETSESFGSYHTEAPLPITADNLGRFRIVETNSRSGYAADWMKEIRADWTEHDEDGRLITRHTIRLEAANEPNEVRVRKVDEDGNPLAGAAFVLESAAGEDDEPDGDDVRLEGVSGEDGLVHFQKLPAGHYILRETAGVSGYRMDETEYAVTVDEKGLIRRDGDTEGARVLTLTVTNRRNLLRVLKTDGTSKKALAGARFRITSASDGSSFAEKTCGADGTAAFEGIPDGLWYLEETATPAGYALTAVKRLFYVDGGGIHMQYGDEPQAEYTWTVWNGTLPQVEVLLEKRDEADPSLLLSGAAFGIWPYC